MTQTKNIDLMTTTNLIRATLKQSFPGIKFSVKTERFSMGNSVNIRYTDGPTTNEVNAVVRGYSGGDFDGMVDLYNERYVTDANGDCVHYGAKYIQVDRQYSIDFLQRMVDYAEPRYAWTMEPEFEVVGATKYSFPYVRANNTLSRFGNDWAQDYFARLCAQTPASELPEATRLEESI